MRAGRRHLAALTVGAALLASAGCGSDDEKGEPLPADAVATLDRRLDEVERRFRAGTEDNNIGACNDIENDSYKAIEKTVEGLPEDVDQDVRDALEDSLARLKELTSEGCSEVEPTRTEPETTPEETTPPPTVTETVPAPPEREETQPPQTTPEEESNGNGKGNGDGDGNGQGGPTPPGQTGGTTPGAEEN